jgi:hypothetical protein
MIILTGMHRSEYTALETADGRRVTCETHRPFRSTFEACRAGQTWGEAVALFALAAMEHARNADGMQDAMTNLGRLFRLAATRTAERSGKEAATAFAFGALAAIHDAIAQFDDIFDPTAYPVKPRSALEAAFARTLASASRQRSRRMGRRCERRYGRVNS